MRNINMNNNKPVNNFKLYDHDFNNHDLIDTFRNRKNCIFLVAENKSSGSYSNYETWSINKIAFNCIDHAIDHAKELLKIPSKNRDSITIEFVLLK